MCLHLFCAVFCVLLGGVSVGFFPFLFLQSLVDMTNLFLPQFFTGNFFCKSPGQDSNTGN